VTSGRATTAVIIAQDEAERIGECVRSVRRCVDEVVDVRLAQALLAWRQAEDAPGATAYQVYG